MYVLYGAASGPVPPFDLMRLNSKSLAIRRPTLASFTATEKERVGRLSELISLAEHGLLRYPRTKIFPITDVASAHQLIESRGYSGKIGIDPWKI
jgi:NADPH2:quinone reductase